MKLDELLQAYGLYLAQLKNLYKNDFYINTINANDGSRIIKTSIKIFNKNYETSVDLDPNLEVVSCNCNCGEETNLAEGKICDHILLLLDKYHRLISKGTPIEDNPVKVVGNITYHDYSYEKDGIKIKNKRRYVED